VIEKGKPLFKFNLSDMNLCIACKNEQVFVELSTDPSYPEIPLDIPVPYDHSSPWSASSTYDTIDRRSLEFNIVESQPDQCVIDISICEEHKYWYYGSLDDDWHGDESTIKKRLSVRRDISNKLNCHLKDMNKPF
jgi:hypothetical protein